MDSSEEQANSEIVKRLTPTKDVLRRLYLHSGNRCAFPNCADTMMDEDGTFVGEICHIEAAEEGGERFNPLQTNEQRRAFENLLLMCHRHHVKTDDVDAYPVPKLRELKRQHEAKYSSIEEKLAASFEDHSFSGPGIRECHNLGHFEIRDEYRAECVAEMKELGRRLNLLPMSSREFLAGVARRAAERSKRNPARFGRSKVNPDEVKNAFGISESRLFEEVRILEDHHFAAIDDDGDQYYIYLYGVGNWERILEEIVGKCEELGFEPQRVLCKLEFDVFDN